MILKGVKPVKQKMRMCGPASLEIVLKYYGYNITQKELKKMLGSTILSGTSNTNMVKVAKNLGLKAQFKHNSSFAEIKKLISNKIPPIVGWITETGGSHYSVVSGIDENYIYIIDPIKNDTIKFKIEDFEKRWLDVHWAKLNRWQGEIANIKIFINNIFNKKTNYKLPLKSDQIIHKEIIIIEKK